MDWIAQMKVSIQEPMASLLRAEAGREGGESEVGQSSGDTGAAGVREGVHVEEAAAGLVEDAGGGAHVQEQHDNGDLEHMSVDNI